MAKVVYTGIRDYDVRSAAATNAVLSPFATQSTNLTSPNFRDEGLDDRVLAANAVTGGYDIASYEADPESFGNTTAALIEFNTPNVKIEIDNGGAGWTLGSNESLRIRFGSEFRTDVFGPTSVPDLSESQDLHFQLYYREGGVDTAIPVTHMRFTGVRFVWPNPLPTNPVAQSEHYQDSVTLSWLLAGTAAGRVIQKVWAVAWIDFGDYELRCTSIQATAFWR